MKIIETTFERLPRERLVIGFEGENLRATVRIDCSSVFAEYPNATPTLIVKPLFADAYPVVVDRNGTDVDWLITSEILSFSGYGEIQLVFYKDQVICKSAVSKIRVSRSLTVTGDMPDPVAQWIDDANAKLAEVDAALVSIDEMDAVASGLPEGAEPTVEVSMVNDHKRLSFGIPKGDTGEKGDKGDKGDKGEVGATPQMGIGTVQTLPAGSAATASMSGTTENPLLNLGIPQGIQGVKGDRGEKGETGATGATGATPDLSIGTVSTLPAGSSATAEITGTAENPVLSLGIPQGVQGIQGEKGEKGDPGDGVPVGGLKDQVLAKASDTDRDTKWMYVAPVVKNEASGSIASFPDGADGHPVDELKVAIEPVQDLHGYDNPWPAGGGKNLLNTTPAAVKPLNTHGTWNGNSYTDTGVTFAISDDGVITVNGTATNTTYFELGSFETGTIEHVLNGLVGTYQSTCSLVGISGSWYPVRDAQGATLPQSATVRICVYVATGAALTNYVFKPMIRLASETDATFAPYSNICPIAGWTAAKVTRTGKNLFCGDIEQGTFTNSGVEANTSTRVRTGFIRVDKENTIFLNTNNANLYIHEVYGFDKYGNFVHRINSGMSASSGKIIHIDADKYVRFSIRKPDNTNIVPADVTSLMVEYGSESSGFEQYGTAYPITFPSEAGTVYGGELTVNADGSGSLVVDRAVIASYNGESLPGEWISDRDVYTSGATPTTGAQVVYKLSTPITYTLTASQIRTLLGTNNVWSDAGDVSVKYNADTKLYIDGKIAELVAQIVNS